MKVAEDLHSLSSLACTKAVVAFFPVWLSHLYVCAA